MSTLTFKRTSPYQTIEVRDDRIEGHRLRHLYLDAVEHSAIDLDQPENTVHLYTDFVYLAWIFKKNPQCILVAGLGGGAMPMRLRDSHPKIKIDVVEIDPDIVAVAKTYFQVNEDAHLRIRVSDAYQYLRESDQRFDVIILDIYKSKDDFLWLPPRLATPGFFRMVDKRLSHDGVMVLNLVGPLKGKQAQKTLAVIKKLETLFPQVYLFPIYLKKAPNLEESRNILVVCSRDKKRLNQKTMLQRAKTAARSNPSMKHLSENAENFYSL